MSLLSVPTTVAIDVAKDFVAPPAVTLSCTAAALETMKVIDVGERQFLLAYPDPKVDRACGAGALKHLLETYQPLKSP